MNTIVILLFIGFCMMALPVMAEDTVIENMPGSNENTFKIKEVKFYDENGNHNFSAFCRYTLEDTDYLIEQGLLSTSPTEKQEEHSPLDMYLDTAYLAALNYSSGNITYDELECTLSQIEYLMKYDYHVIEFISSRNISELKEMHEITFPVSDWENGVQEIGSINIVNQMIEIEESPDMIMTYYELQGGKPFILYLTLIDFKMPKDKMGLHTFGANKGIYITIYTYSIVSFDGLERSKKDCPLPYQQSAFSIIEYTDEKIAEAKRNGIDISGAERIFKTSKDLYEQGRFINSYNAAQLSLVTIEGSIELKKFRDLSENEKIRFIEDTIQDIPEEDIKIEKIDPQDEEIEKYIGSNFQMNFFLGNESNSFFTFTRVIDAKNNSVIIYNNQLVGEYDIYAAVDYTTIYELWLMDEAGENGFDFGKRVTVALIDGDIKIKPFWKIYKIFELIKTM